MSKSTPALAKPVCLLISFLLFAGGAMAGAGIVPIQYQGPQVQAIDRQGPVIRPVERSGPLIAPVESHGSSIKPLKTSSIRPLDVTPIKPLDVTPIKPLDVTPIKPLDVTPTPKPKSRPISSIFGLVWHLSIPGAVWSTTDVYSGNRVDHVSAGSGRLPHELKISADGTYVWRAYGKTISGRWVKGQSDYPILLLRAYDGKNWKVKTNGQDLRLWDGLSQAGEFRGQL